MMNDWIRLKHVEQTKNCGIKKIDYKNCASRWSLTHMHFTSLPFPVKESHTTILAVTLRPSPVPISNIPRGFPPPLYIL